MLSLVQSEFRDIPIDGQNFKIILLKDLGDYALYLNYSDNCFSGFEVHRIRMKNPEKVFYYTKDKGIVSFNLPKRRIIATSKEFGRYAWHYPTLELVYEKFPVFNDCLQVGCGLMVYHSVGVTPLFQTLKNAFKRKI